MKTTINTRGDKLVIEGEFRGVLTGDWRADDAIQKKFPPNPAYPRRLRIQITQLDDEETNE